MNAGDTKLSRSAGTKDDQMALQADLHSQDQWSTYWQLKFNAVQCKIMHLGAKSQHISYSMMNWWYWRKDW